MKSVRIIPDIDGLLSVHNVNETENEFELLFTRWNDTEYLRSFFKEHKSDLGMLTITEAIDKTFDDAADLEALLINVAEDKTDLQVLFKPLSNNEYKLRPYQTSKVYGTIRKSWLRVYAVRITSDLFVITGGAIKLTRTMEERDHTKDQLRRISKARNYLKEQGFSERDLKNLEIE